MTPPNLTVDRIDQCNDPEVFLALYRVCNYLVHTAWDTFAIGDEEETKQYNDAVKLSKRHERDVKVLAALDTEIGWGHASRKMRGGSWITTKEEGLNPWFEGDLRLTDLLSSIESLIEQTDAQLSLSPVEVEFVHFYNFLFSRTKKMQVSADALKSTVIDFDSLHPKIKQHCASLFRNKHYSEAIFTAYKVIFNEIKIVTGIVDLDGKRLAERAFLPSNPAVHLNDLTSQSDIDEQAGYMLLYSGAAVGIRNPKAHDLVVQEDPYRTLQLLTFASLLLTRLDQRVKP